MRIIERPLQNATVLELHGSLTGAAGELLDATVRRVTRTGSPRLVLDMEDVPSIDAAGLGALVTVHGVARQRGGALRLAHVARRVQALLVVCRLVTVFETFDAVEDAVAAGAEPRADQSTTGIRATGGPAGARSESSEVMTISRSAREKAGASQEESC